MRTPRFPARLTAPLALAAVAVLAPASPAADPPKGEVYAVLILDTNRRGLGNYAQKDGDYVEEFLRGGIGDDLLHIKRFEGAEATWETFATYLEGISPTADDALFCYISGHGGTPTQDVGTDGHVIGLSGTGDQDVRRRREVRAKLVDKKARLTVLMTDSCNGNAPALPKTDEGPAPVFSARGASEVSAAFQPLFMNAHGVVDINASAESDGLAKGQFAWYDNQGGVFARALRKTFYDLDAANKKATWPEFYYGLVVNTDDIFKTYKSIHKPAMEESDKKGELNKTQRDDLKALKDQESQRPEAYYLAGVQLGVLVYGTNGEGMEVTDIPLNCPAVGKLKLRERIVKVNGESVLYRDDWNRVMAAAIRSGQTRIVFEVVGTDGAQRTQEINLAAP